MFEQRKSTERDGVLISDLSNHRFLRFYLSVFFFVSTKKIYKTFKTVFDYIYLEFFKNTDSAASRIFNSLLGVWSNTVFRVWYITSRTSRMPNTTLYPLLIHFLNKTSPENPSDNRQVKNTKRRFSWKKMQLATSVFGWLISILIENRSY